MTPIINIFQKVIVAKFYEQNAGLFLFLFFLMFGIVESSQLVYYHYSLMLGIINSPIFLLVACGIWLLYMLKCIQFITSRFDLAENEFIFRLSLLDRKDQIVILLITLIEVDLPVLIYSFILIVIAIYKSNFFIGGIILLVHISLTASAAIIVFRKINYRHVFIRSLSLPALKWKGPRPLPFFYLGHLTDQMKTILWVTKGFSIFVLIGFFQIQPDEYDVRVPLLGFLFGLAAHSVVVFEFRRFEDQYLAFTRNLPLSLLARFGSILLVYLIILSPELILLVVNKVRILDAMGVIIYGSGFLLLVHCFLYLKALDMEKHTQRLLLLFLISFMIVLSHLYLLEAGILLASAFILFSKNFYWFEAAN